MSIANTQSDLVQAQFPNIPVTAANLAALPAAMALEPDGAIGKALDSGLLYTWNGVDTLTPIDPHPLDNAEVPTGAIAPAGAWVAFMQQAYEDGAGEPGVNINLGDTSPSHINSALFGTWVQTVAFFGTGSLSFTVGAGSLNLTDVNEIIQIAATLGIDADVIDVSSGTNAAPTLSAGRVSGTWVLTVTGVPVGTFELTAASTEGTGLVLFGTDITTDADTSVTAANIKTFIDALVLGGWSTVQVSNVVTVTVAGDDVVPLVAGTDSATNFTIDNVAGSKSYIGRIEARGGSVTHN